MSGFVPYGRQQIRAEDVEAVVRVLRSDFLTQGPVVPAFEAAIATHCSVAHAVAVNSATSALHIACLALGVGPGDRVWTSPITFVASANCALYCGATVDFVDVAPDTGNLCIEQLEQRLVQAQRGGQLPKVVIPVHLCGRSCDMKAIRALSQRFGFSVIEDASHAIGAHYDDQPVGSCRYSDVTVFSFHPVKIITTAEGGVAVTADPAIAERMARLRSHGITRDPALMTGEPDGPWYYQQIELGFNYRMTEMQAALGLSQMDRLETFIAARHRIARRYDELLAGLPLERPPSDASGSRSALHLYPIRLNPDLDRRRVFETLRSHQIGVNVHYIPVYLQPFYAKHGFRPGHCPSAEAYYLRIISLPMFPDLSDNDQTRVVDILKDAVT
ncbi:UDP-4-amino-4,6-dideoxy-N-acetyl-beta-L-altrosamine transaminase [Denitromonas ohlonensis]|uniref:UDP-4-amino-4, 6-dideoxy-N-acetyl-beta-L-altrosamine transaminase n=2 Tax=Denitromonas TaxID=139331 RepID=A0A557R527_9RHOO|nr:UDP-4-amino-4,6-dideoxy-N-acetyl-beta-L-altrosamine transaminase [Denitromonas ohlonensis]TVO60258.1 UDP-4-amino-4,6-dideoxy-N-acetyl-beta-L-altrosamine transaminase [Denitromonas ohlonensis]TVO75763.1 UDP-4-amino-4,6-dideoxy-N-acetyl-beta-L-altrosamine transaminase [Denitromonas ohlonensis]